MHIIYLHQYFNTPRMPGSTRSFEIGRRLVAAGHQVEVVTSWQEASQSGEWFVTEEAGMRVHWLPVRYSNHMSYGERMRAFVRFALGAARRAASLGGDVVFATSTPLTIAIPGIYCSRRRRIPLVFEVRDLWPELPIAMDALRNPVLRWAARRLEQIAYASSTRVVALSPGMKAGIVGTGYSPQRVAVIPNGADLNLFHSDEVRARAFRRAHGIGEDKVVVGYAGTLGRINDVGYLVRLAAVLKDDPRLLMLIIGDGQERTKIEESARASGVLERNLRMIPRIPKAQMPDALAAMDIATSLFLPLPQMEANSANKFFDALAAGRCVAINYGGWQEQLLREADAGIRLSTDLEQAARALQRLATDPQRLAGCGRNARRLAEKEFSRDVLAAKVEAVIVEAVNSRASRAMRREQA